MQNDREVVQVAFGSSACHLTSHWLNLQGLAATGNICSSSVTHGVYHETYVPRAILVDSAPLATKTEDPLQPIEEDSQRSNISYEEFSKLASSLAFHSSSRYRVNKSNDKAQRDFSSTGRHVNWDEEDEGEEDHNDENESENKRRQQEAWKKEFASVQETLESFWTSSQSIPPTSKESTDWRTIFMPPYRPDCLITAPRMSFGDSVVETYTSAQSDSGWMESTVWEMARQRLEECDSCQGLLLSHSGGAYAGWATSFLREWNDECPNKSCFVVASSEPSPTFTSSWAEKRHCLQQLLVLNDHSDLADVVLPCDFGATNITEAAYALETATLPFRLQPSNQAKTLISSVALNQDDFTGALSFREFVRTLQRQSASRNVLHLSSLQPGQVEDSSLQTALLKGTSIHRDYRMRRPGYAGGTRRERDELPGQWLSEASVSEGLMTCWLPTAPSRGTIGDRSLHYNFTSSAALRMEGRENFLNDYSTCLLESLGIRYRPEQAMATVVTESLLDLTRNGYAAGSFYWTQHKNNQRSGGSVMATLDNSSRVYPYLYHLAMTTEHIVTPSSRRSLDRSRYNQDLVLGLVPELDDTKDDLTNMLDLRDSYTPPQSSGLVFENNDHANGQF